MLILVLSLFTMSFPIMTLQMYEDFLNLQIKGSKISLYLTFVYVRLHYI